MWCILPLFCLIIITDQIQALEEVHILQSAINAKQYYDLDKIEDLFNEFIVTYQKEYNEEEYDKKLEIFKKNVEEINDLNKNSTTAAFGITKFADLSPDELANYTGRSHPSLRYSNPFCPYVVYQPKGPIPANWDYRKFGYVTPVRNQQQCGSCYAHSTIGNLEGQYFKQHGKLMSFSEQQIVDCDPYNNGCGGGYEDKVMTYINEVGGIQSYKDYPYTASKGHCRFRKHKAVAQVVGCLRFGFTNEEYLAHALIEHGPLSIAITSANSLMSYNHGVMSSYIPTDGNHAVLLVGYGTENGIPYWTMKNSWGAQWGESGFFRVLRGRKLFSISDFVMTGIVA